MSFCWTIRTQSSFGEQRSSTWEGTFDGSNSRKFDRQIFNSGQSMIQSYIFGMRTIWNNKECGWRNISTTKRKSSIRLRAHSYTLQYTPLVRYGCLALEMWLILMEMCYHCNIIFRFQRLSAKKRMENLSLIIILITC